MAGSVFDASRGVVRGASVAATDVVEGLRREALTDERGLYSLPLLPAGIYEISAELKGFRSAKVAGVKVTVDATLTAIPTLQVEGVSETSPLPASRRPWRFTVLVRAP